MKSGAQSTARINPEEVKAAFDLYLLHNGERFDLIEQAMHRLGYTTFKRSKLKSRGYDENRREGWIEQFGWEKSLQLKIATANTAAKTSAESLLFEVEAIRKKLFTEIEILGVGRGGKDVVWQHDKYVNRSIEILGQLNDARDNYANFVFFLKHLLPAASQISPALAAELVEAEEALIEWAEKQFVTEENVSE